MQLEQRPTRDSLPLLLQDWSLRPVLQADLQLAIALTLAPGQALAVVQPPQVVPAVAEVVLVLDW